MTGFQTVVTSSPEPIIQNQNSNTEELIKNIQELNSTIKSMDAGATRYSNALFAISLIMMVLALIQIFLAIISISFFNWTQRGMLFITTIIVFGFFTVYIVSALKKGSK